MARVIEEMRQFAYNWRRPHGSLGGKRPVDRIGELADSTPLHETCTAAYDRTRERVRHRNYRVDQEMASLWNVRHSVAVTSAAPAADCPLLTELKVTKKRKKIGLRISESMSVDNSQFRCSLCTVRRCIRSLRKSTVFRGYVGIISGQFGVLGDRVRCAKNRILPNSGGRLSPHRAVPDAYLE
jgi:transposase InsO family protein